MLFEKVFTLKFVFFGFTFCIGTTLLHPDLEGGISSVSLYWDRCRFLRRRLGLREYPIHNSWYHFHRTLCFKLPLFLSYFRIVQLSFKIQEKRICFFVHVRRNRLSLNVPKGLFGITDWVLLLFPPDHLDAAWIGSCSYASTEYCSNSISE